MDSAEHPRFSEHGSPQDAPATIVGARDGTTSQFKIDAAIRAGGMLFLTGWSDCEELSFEVRSDSVQHPCLTQRVERSDVRRTMGFTGKGPFGFSMCAGPCHGDEVSVGLITPGGAIDLALNYDPEIPDHARAYMLPAMFAFLKSVPVGSDPWSLMIAQMPQDPHPQRLLQGHIDVAIATQSTGACSGWECHAPDALIWLEDDQGRAYDLDKAYRWIRPDIEEAEFDLGDGTGKSGFLRHLSLSAGAESLRLCGCGPSGRAVLPFMRLDPLSTNAVAVAKRLFAVSTPMHEFTARVAAVDLPFLGAVRRREAEIWGRDGISMDIAVGPQPKTPTVSVIVPLYGRLDMVENQLLEFARDPAFAEDVELIYALDDPTLEGQLRTSAPHLQRICGPSFRIVSAGQNRGFSSACNMGASVARAGHLIFMNSDVFPIEPGWAQALCDVLDSRRDIGLVAPRLVFPDGSLQHAGMVPRLHAHLGLWTNHHPLMGMDAAFDPAKALRVLPLVTGACVAMRRGDFEQVGRWDTGFLIGDFEDSDLCFRLQEHGMSCAYLPDVSLIHLERQSFALSGEGDFRGKVTLFNAVRYNMRWAKTLAQFDTTQDGGAA